MNRPLALLLLDGRRATEQVPEGLLTRLIVSIRHSRRMTPADDHVPSRLERRCAGAVADLGQLAWSGLRSDPQPLLLVRIAATEAEANQADPQPGQGAQLSVMSGAGHEIKRISDSVS